MAIESRWNCFKFFSRKAAKISSQIVLKWIVCAVVCARLRVRNVKSQLKVQDLDVLIVQVSTKRVWDQFKWLTIMRVVLKLHCKFIISNVNSLKFVQFDGLYSYWCMKFAFLCNPQARFIYTQRFPICATHTQSGEFSACRVAQFSCNLVSTRTLTSKTTC